MKRRRAGESADGLALMTSSMTSSYSADDFREQSQESAVYLDLHGRPLPLLQSLTPSAAAQAPPSPHVDRTCSDHRFEEFPSVLISSGLLVQVDEGTLLPVVDLIRRNLPPPTVKSQSPCDSGWSQAPVSSEVTPRETPYEWFIVLFVLY
ncbi:hypothetical protein F511_40645 [Dorcoceras hygrometricum]|uniref:Uncharacterized protein n=1 Tax=Dorcoceras hygrometricum TaxID=472368 RepID=A0A2Z7AXB6_9LAMI|nr:hypothetical protein F511_40645 [Dorcoceras hygrometricum]